jgi:hypothetical protein
VTRPYSDDTPQAHEWRCPACGIINDEGEPRCWECGADTDGQKAKDEDV